MPRDEGVDRHRIGDPHSLTLGHAASYTRPMPRSPTRHASLLAQLQKAFDADSAAGEHVRYQLELSGQVPGSVWLDVRDGRLESGTGRVVRPDVTFHLACEDLESVLSGNANPDLLFMEERIRVEGELSLALKLRKLFRVRE